MSCLLMCLFPIAKSSRGLCLSEKIKFLLSHTNSSCTSTLLRDPKQVVESQTVTVQRGKGVTSRPTWGTMGAKGSRSVPCHIAAHPPRVLRLPHFLSPLKHLPLTHAHFLYCSGTSLTMAPRISKKKAKFTYAERKQPYLQVYRVWMV